MDFRFPPQRRARLSLVLSSTALMSFHIGTALAGSVTTPASYLDLGTLGGATSVASGVSGDGSTVVGSADASSGFAHAFRWTSTGGLVDMGTFGGNSSTAYGASFDGSVIVGSSQVVAGNTSHAFRWTAAGGMVDLGTLFTTASNPQPQSGAFAVNRDGSVVVGYSQYMFGKKFEHAFRWTAAGGMVDLGSLGGLFARALAVNSDGSVVVGKSTVTTTNGAPFHAFRWTTLTKSMTDLGTLGGSSSIASGVNADGTVVVGSAANAGGNDRAFRWTQASNTMVDLGTLGGTASQAFGVNADGTVIVGSANVANGTSRAFRWTQNTNTMVSVDDWLRSQGISLAADITSTANGVSADGNVVVGQLQNNHAFIARGSTTVKTPDPTMPTQQVSAGLMDVTNYQASLGGAGQFSSQIGMSDMTINGANSSPLFYLLDAGSSDAWVTGDVGRTYGANGLSASPALGQIGFSHSPAQGVVLRLSGGATYTDQSLAFGGYSRTSGYYVVPEATVALGNGVYGTLTGYGSWSGSTVRRGYANGAGTDFSTGSASIQTYGVRARLDWQDAARIGEASLSPYASYTFSRTFVGSYTEQGGAFPAFIRGGSEVSNVVRLGTDITHAFTPSLTLIGRAEYAHRFESTGAATTGTILGLSDFSFPGAAVRQDWVRGGLGAKIALGQGEAFAMVNASSQSAGGTYWLNLGYRVKF